MVCVRETRMSEDSSVYTCDGCGGLTPADEPLQDLVFCTTCWERYQFSHSAHPAPITSPR